MSNIFIWQEVIRYFHMARDDDKVLLESGNEQHDLAGSLERIDHEISCKFIVMRFFVWNNVLWNDVSNASIAPFFVHWIIAFGWVSKYVICWGTEKCHIT